MEPYKINEAFTVIPQSNLINELKLEPRLMKLLCLLVSSPGNLITREEIIEKIWQGYGGGDEGLTQAISFLRKILHDTGKTIIETVPKSGYIFHGKIQKVELTGKADNVAFKRRSSGININAIIIATLLLLALFAIILYRPGPGQQNLAPKAETNHTPAPSNGIAPEAK